MKKKGVINAQLMKELTELGHFDSFVICDMGFPIPKDAVKVDLTVIPGLPRFLPVLKACLNEVVVQEMVLLDGIKTANGQLHEKIMALVNNQEVRYCSLNEFREQTANVKFFVRSAETMPCSNIALVSASGVKERVEKYNIEIDLDQEENDESISL